MAASASGGAFDCAAPSCGSWVVALGSSAVLPSEVSNDNGGWGVSVAITVGGAWPFRWLSASSASDDNDDGTASGGGEDVGAATIGGSGSISRLDSSQCGQTHSLDLAGERWLIEVDRIEQQVLSSQFCKTFSFGEGYI
jgi:hypothetical protein